MSSSCVEEPPLLRSGWLPAGEGQHRIYWETCGRPDGSPVVYLHGGPGAGLHTGYRSWTDPERHLLVGLDQRGCGRSRPLVVEDLDTLRSNTTRELVADLEALRVHLQLPAWLVVGVSWGTTLALSYAQAHPDRVRGLVLMSTTLTDTRAVEWITETVGALFPREWDEFADYARGRFPGRTGRLVDLYRDLVIDPDPVVHEPAVEAWMRWEAAHISLGRPPRLQPGALTIEERSRRRVFATVVTHYWANAAFLTDGALEASMGLLADTPGVLIQGKLDVSGPAGVAWNLHKRWPASQFVLIDDEGHGGPQMAEALVRAIHELA